MNNGITKKDTLLIVVGIIVTILIFYILLQYVDLQQMLQLFSKTEKWFILPALLISLTAKFFLAPFKWFRLLKFYHQTISFKETFLIWAAMTPMRAIFPLKSGALLHAVYLNRHHEVDWSKGVSSVVFDKFYNLLALLSLVPLAVIFLQIPLSIKIPTIILFLLFLILLFFGIGIRGAWSKLVPTLPTISFSQKLELFIMALIFQLSDVLVFFLVFKSLNSTPPFGMMLLYIPLAGIISNIPITIMGIGSREALLLVLFKSLYSPETLLGAGIIFSFVSYFITPLAGLPFMLPFIKTWFQKKRDINFLK